MDGRSFLAKIVPNYYVFNQRFDQFWKLYIVYKKRQLLLEICLNKTENLV